ncbi:transposable element Tc1 transposase [Trichonephila clavipes]|nr:transposable element Tc1 transposase [Trichonephila clavipes]
MEKDSESSDVSDETKFSLECDTRCVLEWQEKITRNNPIFVRKRSHYGLGGLMIWTGIFIDMHIIWKGNLIAQRYTDEILRLHVIPYATAVGDLFRLMQDDARYNTAFIVENLIEAETKQSTGWPACFLILNPIKHIWYTFRRHIVIRGSIVTNRSLYLRIFYSYPCSQDISAFLKKGAPSPPCVVRPIKFLIVIFRGSAHRIKELTAMAENSASLECWCEAMGFIIERTQNSERMMDFKMQLRH